MITFSKENIVDIIDEMMPLLIKHSDEVATYDFFELDIDMDRYKEATDNGIFQLYTAREEDGTLVGYVCYMVTRSIHYMKEIYGVMDVIYVHEDYRHNGTAFDMMQYAEDSLIDMGVTMLTINMKTWAPFETLATFLGYDKMEYMYTKYVGE